MSQRYKGAVISATPPTTTSGNSGTAPGIWTMQQQLQAQGANAWPSFTPVYIEDVFSTYLYTGNGTGQSINNGIALGNSNGGGSVLFDGTGDWLSVASSSGFNLGTGDFTVECWVYRTAASGGYETMLGFDVTGGLLFELYGNQLDFGIRGTANNTSGVTVPSYQWVHLALARQSGVVRYFQNGSLIYTYTGTYATQNFTNNTAALVSSYSPGAGVFNGYISNLRLVKGTALYTSSFTPSTSPLTAVSGTSLLTCQGNTPFVDNSGNALAITRNGDSSAQVSGPFTVTGVGQGGLVWLKSRTANGASSHYLVDTVRGPQSFLFSNLNWAASTYPAGYFSFLVNGFNLNDGGGNYNINAVDYASWTFRKQPKFFDVVTWTGDGASSRQISHSLGATPGCIIVKGTTNTGSWTVYHRSLGATKYMLLNDTSAESVNSLIWNDTAPTSTNFTVGGSAFVNASGVTYVAYLFAHDAGGFGLTGTDNVITCGSYVGTGAGTPPSITLGYEPQWIMIKAASGGSAAFQNWNMFDNMRGLPVGGQDALLLANLSDAEATNTDYISVNATGFQVVQGNGNATNQSGTTYIYIAIRRGPMKTPTSGTSVYLGSANTASTGVKITTGFPVDLQIAAFRSIATNRFAIDRLRGTSSSTTESSQILRPNATDAEISASYARYWDNTGYQVSSAYADNSMIEWNFGRAPSFMDMVCYTGTGSATTQSHNLGVAPEFMLVKSRSNATDWMVYAAPLGNTQTMYFQRDNPAQVYPAWNNTTPTSTVFSLNGSGYAVNNSGLTYVAYLFASCPGVSKVGSYSGTGATQTISCGFAARFVLIKRTDDYADWLVWDTSRGMVSGTDPRLVMNLTSVEANANWVYTNASGFQIVTTDASVNANGGSYIYLAIA